MSSTTVALIADVSIPLARLLLGVHDKMVADLGHAVRLHISQAQPEDWQGRSRHVQLDPLLAVRILHGEEPLRQSALHDAVLVGLRLRVGGTSYDLWRVSGCSHYCE